jgi:hypothetical protein
VILKGSQRAGAKQLSQHLLNERDNDHVTVLDVRGFVTDDRLVDLLEALSRLLPLTDAESADRRNVLATLENIETVQRRRQTVVARFHV